MIDGLPGVTPMKWMTPEVSAAFPLVVAASLIESGLVRSHNDLKTLATALDHQRSLLREDQPRLSLDEHNMIAILQAFLLRGLTAFVEDVGDRRP